MNKDALVNQDASEAAIARDVRALRAALTAGPVPPTIQNKPTIFWATEALKEVPSDQRAAAMEILELLLAAGADVNAHATRDAKITPLMEAASQGNLPAMRRLLAASADPMAQTAMGATALHWAAAAGSLAGVRLLVEQHDVPINAPNHTKETALHWAAKRLNRAMIRELYHLGADFHLANTSRQTSLDVIALKDPRLSEFWRHKPGRDALESATPPAPNTSPQRARRL